MAKCGSMSCIWSLQSRPSKGHVKSVTCSSIEWEVSLCFWEDQTFTKVKIASHILQFIGEVTLYIF